MTGTCLAGDAVGEGDEPAEADGPVVGDGLNAGLDVPGLADETITEGEADGWTPPGVSTDGRTALTAAMNDSAPTRPAMAPAR